MPLLRPAALIVSTLLSASAAAVPAIFNDDLVDGPTAFDAAIAGSGAALQTLTLRFLADGGRRFEFPGVLIEATDGSARPVDDDYANLRWTGHVGAMTGWAIGIVPNEPTAGSGLTFQFAHPVNAFGIEIGDWATCCFASSLYIAFDGGATRLVASAAAAGDNPGFVRYGQHTNFVAAIDDTGSFSRVTLYGDGVGEYLVAGGTLRWATVPAGTVTSVPEPEGWAMLAVGLAVVARRLRDNRLRA